MWTNNVLFGTIIRDKERGKKNMRRKRNYNYSPYSRRRRIRWDNVLKVVIPVVVVLVLVITFNFSRIRLAMKGYSWSQQSAVLKLTSDKVKIVIDDDYLDHIDSWLKHSKDVKYYADFEKYQSLHKKMKAADVVDTLSPMLDDQIPSLKKNGYTEKQIWTILKTADSDDLDYILEKGYSYNTMKNYMAVSGFKFKDMDKYEEAYKSSKNYNYAVLSTSYPFIGDSTKEATRHTITDPARYTTLVKKGLYLPSSYKPSDLVTPDKKYITKKCDHPKLRKEAYKAFLAMRKAGEKEGYYIMINSGYRSYDEQSEIYKEYKQKWGELYAIQHVALPGASEHQTGLGIDMSSESVDEGKRLVFGDTSEYKWACKNAYKYGFVLRFADGTSKITGITQEPWHFRYVGKKAAKIMYENNWTLEEYCLYTGDLPALKS